MAQRITNKDLEGLVATLRKNPPRQKAGRRRRRNPPAWQVGDAVTAVVFGEKKTGRVVKVGRSGLVWVHWDGRRAPQLDARGNLKAW